MHFLAFHVHLWLFTPMWEPLRDSVYRLKPYLSDGNTFSHYAI